MSEHALTQTSWQPPRHLSRLSRRYRTTLIGIGACAILLGCETRQAGVPPAGQAASPAQRERVASFPPPVAAPAVRGATAPKAPIAGLDDYKLAVANEIVRANPSTLFAGAPPPSLKSIVVLSISVDADGQPRRVAVLRSNGYRELEQTAVQSVRRAAPLPRPERNLMRLGLAEFVETWLFRDDGQFQIRSLAEAQAGLHE